MTIHRSYGRLNPDRCLYMAQQYGSHGAPREFLSDTIWGALDCLFLDLPPGTDRIAALADILPALTGMILVTIPAEVSHLVVRKSLALTRNLKVPCLA